MGIIDKATKLIGSHTIHSHGLKRISLFEVREAIPEYKKHMTSGKYLIYPQLKENYPKQIKNMILIETEANE